jgi:hypothetical protein
MENGPNIYFTSMIYLFKIAQVWVLHVHGGDLEMEKAHGGDMERPPWGNRRWNMGKKWETSGASKWLSEAPLFLFGRNMVKIDLAWFSQPKWRLKPIEDM